MVAVPGRSTGCASCRQRKVGCDGKRPCCDRCTRTGRTCEGYDRPTTFLNRFPGPGLDRRGSQEDVNALTRPRPSSQTSSPLSMATSGFQPPGRRLTGSNDTASPSRPPMRPTQSMDNSAVIDEQLFASFVDTYLPDRQSRPYRQHWLQHVMLFKYKNAALHWALKGIATSRLAWHSKDEVLSRSGYIAYTRALQETQTALGDAVLSQSDQTLAAVHLLLIHETFQPTTDSVEGWDRHSNGVSSLVKAREPGNFQSLLGLALLEDVLNASMFYSLQTRKGSVFSEKQWTMDLVTRAFKNPDQELYHLAFELAALAMDVDLFESVNGLDIHLLTSAFLDRYGLLDGSLQDWKMRLPTGARPDEKSSPSDSSETDLTFPNLSVGLRSISGWAVQLNFSNLVFEVCSHILHRSDLDRSRHELIDQLHVLLKRHNSRHMTTLARKIVGGVPYCIGDSMGMYGPQKSLFALYTAWCYFETNGPDGDLRRCNALVNRLVIDKGVVLAGPLTSLRRGGGAVTRGLDLWKY